MFIGQFALAKRCYDYFGARYYDARVGRWGSVEPLTDKYPGVSPYCYALNMPIALLDVDGLDIIIAFTGLSGFIGSEVDPSSYSKESSIGVVSLLYDVQNYISDTQKMQDVSVKGYNSSLTGTEKSLALDYVVNNLKEGEKVFVYGYSHGGAIAVEFAKLLQQNNIDVHALFLVDAYHAVA